MQSVARLEAQIALELQELDRIQGVLQELRAEKSTANKENIHPPRQSAPLARLQTGQSTTPVKKTPVKHTRPESKPRLPETTKREASCKSTKKVVLQPYQAAKKESLSRKDLKVSPSIDKPSVDHSEKGVSQKSLGSSHPPSKIESSQSNHFVHIESLKEGVEVKKKSSKVLAAQPQIFNQEFEDTVTEQKVLGWSPVFNDIQEENSCEDEQDITLADLLKIEQSGSKNHRAADPKRIPKTPPRSKTPTKNKGGERSVIELGHEQLEKMYHQFREAKKKAKTFEERVNLMVLEVD